MTDLIPTWVEMLLAVGAVITALGIIYLKVVKPIAQLIVLVDRLLPLAHQQVDAFKDVPNAYQILREIVNHFRTDSGTTLLDIVKRLDEASTKNAAIAQELSDDIENLKKVLATERAAMKRDRRLAIEDRKRLDELDAGLAKMVVIDTRLEEAVERLENTLAKMMENNKQVATELAEERSKDRSR